MTLVMLHLPSEYWNPETVDPFGLGLPEWMRQHKYAGMEVIE